MAVARGVQPAALAALAALLALMSQGVARAHAAAFNSARDTCGDVIAPVDVNSTLYRSCIREDKIIGMCLNDYQCFDNETIACGGIITDVEIRIDEKPIPESQCGDFIWCCYNEALSSGGTSGSGPGTSPGSGPGRSPGSGPGTSPGSGPGTSPGSGPGTSPGSSPGASPGSGPGTSPGSGPGTSPGSGPGTSPGSSPGTSPGSGPGTSPGSGPGTSPGSGPGTSPGSGPGTSPGSGPGTSPGSGPGISPGSGPGTSPGSGPGTSPGSGPGTSPGSGSGTSPGSGPGTSPGSDPGTSPGMGPNTSKCRLSYGDDCPWCVSLYRPGGDVSRGHRRESGLYCAGAMVGARVVLTSATCVRTVADEVVWARVPASADPAHHYTVVEKTMHPNYNTGTHENDFGLLVLKEDVKWADGEAVACVGRNTVLSDDCVVTDFNEREEIIMTSVSVRNGDCPRRRPRKLADVACGTSADERCTIPPGAPLLCPAISDGQGGLEIAGVARKNCVAGNVLLGKLQPHEDWLQAQLRRLGLQLPQHVV